MADSVLQSGSEPDRVWRQIDVVLDELAGLSKSECAVAEFHRECLQRVVAGLGAAGGILWLRPAGGRLTADAQILPQTGQLGDAADPQFAASALSEGRGAILPPGAAVRDGNDLANSGEWLVVLSPWTIGSEVSGVLELFQPPGASPQSQQGYLEFLRVVGELIADFHRRRQLRNYRRWAADLTRVQDFAEQVHRSLDLRQAAYTIANEGRQMIGCDRVSVLARRGGRYRLLAVSGVATVQRRANAVRQIERLAASVCAINEPLWYPDSGTELPPQLAPQVHEYLDASHANALAVLPLTPGSNESNADGEAVIGALVAERFRGLFDEPMRWSLTTLQAHVALALQHARDLDRIPLLRLLRAIGGVRWLWQPGRRAAVALTLAALAVLAIALAVIPGEFRVEARGELQPVNLREVFAPADGVVGEVRVEHNRPVAENEVLAILRRSELDLEYKRVGGELQTARRQFETVEAERMQASHADEERRQRYGQLTAQWEELREQIAGLEAQLAILQQQQAELQVRSPMAGTLLTWNPQQLLHARPVSRGDVLLTVGDLGGPWQLELRVPARRIAHVLEARGPSEKSLPVTFRPASDPGRTCRGVLDRVGLRTEISDTDEACVLATVRLDREQLGERVPGAQVTAQIDCGRRSLAFLWFRDLVDAVRTWFLF